MLESNKISKKYFKKQALLDIDCSIEKGKIYGLLGPNGSGKSTFMKIAAGLVHPTTGTITYNQQPIGTSTKKVIAYMPTEVFFYPFMTITTVGNYFNDFYDDFDMDKFKELIDFMNLDMKTTVKSLSTGMGCKLKIAATLARRAELYMLDEPLNGIDLVAREKILHAIVESANDNNSLIISSHLVDEMEKILDNVIYIKDGSIIMQGEAESLREEKGKSIVNIYKEVYA